MGSLLPVKPVLRVAAITSGSMELVNWAVDQLSGRWGGVALRSPSFAFDQTAYYQASMGANLGKVLIAFEDLCDPAELPGWKHWTNEIEKQAVAQQKLDVDRPVNIDPGYLTEAKLVLASTKDRDHRVYVGTGIYAEITLYYHRHTWVSSRWTYPDFQQPEYHEFLSACRAYLRQRMSSHPGLPAPLPENP